MLYHLAKQVFATGVAIILAVFDYLTYYKWLVVLSETFNWLLKLRVSHLNVHNHGIIFIRSKTCRGLVRLRCCNLCLC